jgi:predicted transcriptional regulator
VTVRLDTPTRALLDRLAEDRGESRSAVVREALAAMARE